MLASVILRLLGSRVVYEDMNLALNPGRGSPLKEAELQMETCADVSLDLSGKNLFDWLLLVLHALLSSSQPSWLTLKFPSKTTVVSAKDFGGFDREILENLQVWFLNRCFLVFFVVCDVWLFLPLLSPFFL